VKANASDHDEGREGPSGSPRWDRVVEIASKLWIDGLYQVELDPCRTQRYVDLQWAAHQAARILGGRAKIERSAPRGVDDRTVTVTVRYVDPDGRSLERAEAGLEKLLHQVLAQQVPGRRIGRDRFP
jgi:hypothetical protein